MANQNNGWILVVDDEPDVTTYLGHLLAENGYTTKSAHDGKEAYAKISEDPPSLILLDIQMPGGTGIGLYRALRKEKMLDDISIIVVSGVVGSELSLPSRIPVIDKPVDRDRLLQEIHKALPVQ
jgi:CheY-like chemotaxis protein